MCTSKTPALTLLCFLLCGRLSAQDFEMDMSGMEDLITVTSEAVESVNADILMTLMNNHNVAWEDPETEIDRAVAELVLAVAKNEKAKLLRTKSALSRHRWASMIAFIIAHTLLIIGLFFGVLEFRQATSLRHRGRKTDKLEVSMSLEGIAVKSSLNGLLLLLISFAFYFAFLHYVYPLSAM